MKIDYLPSADPTNDRTSGHAAVGGESSRNKPRQLARVPTWRPFPIDVYPSKLRRFIDALATTRHVEPAMIAVPLLATLSASIGNARQLRLRSDFTVPAVVWSVLVSETGGGKSPSLDSLMRPIHEVQAAAYAAQKAAMAEWAVKPKPDRGDEPPGSDAMAHYYVNDATTAALASRLDKNPRGLLLYMDELAAWPKSWNQFSKGGGNDRECYLSMYDARAVKIDRKVSGANAGPPTIIVPRAFVAVMGGIQPSILRKLLMTDEMVHCGLHARLLLASPPERPMPWSNVGPCRAALDGYAEVLEALRRLSFDPDAGPGDVVLTEDAMHLWAGWHDMMDGKRRNAASEVEQAAIPKLRMTAARVALILHLATLAVGDDASKGVQQDRLGATSMSAGILVAQWFEYEGIRIRAMLAGGEGVGELRRWHHLIFERCGGFVSVRDWQRQRGLTTSAEARAELAELIEAGLGRLEYVKAAGTKGGRQSERFVAAPPFEAAEDSDDDAREAWDAA